MILINFTNLKNHLHYLMDRNIWIITKKGNTLICFPSY